MKGANWADWDTTWPFVKSLSFAASKMSISGAPRPTLGEGPGWSEPGHEQALEV